MPHTVTALAMDEKTGSSFLWHSCLVLSHGNKVIEAAAYYGLKTDNYVNPSCLRRVKMRVGLNLDSNNHGLLKPEEVRYLDLGCGLHGYTIEVSEAQFKQLQDRIHQTYRDQENAIADYVREHKLESEALPRFKYYPYENRSHEIFDFETKEAKKAGRKPRLEVFELSLLRTAHNCKVKMLELLEGIISSKQMAQLKGKHFAIPRMSKSLKPILLHSVGPLSEYKKPSGEVVYYRNVGSLSEYKKPSEGRNQKIGLFWTLPPSEVHSPSAQMSRLIDRYKPHHQEAHKVAGQLEQIEKIIQSALLEPHYHGLKEELILTIQTGYKAFGRLSRKPAVSYQTSFWQRWLFGAPKDSHEETLLEAIKQAKDLLENLYAAIVDKWDDLSEPETLAAYLSDKHQKEICSIMERKYIGESVSRRCCSRRA